MKFDVVVGNPPYQESREDTRDEAVYNYFYDLAEQLSTQYCLISPARFLFNAGSTDKTWNNKMLSDNHIKAAFYEQNSAKVFPNTDIKGGVVVVYRNSNKDFGKIGIFTSFDELNSILYKVSQLTTSTLDKITSGTDIYQFTPNMHEENPYARKLLSASHPNTVVTSALTVLHNILFFPDRPNDGKEYVKVLGRYENERVYRWIRKEYINQPKDFNTFRVLVPKSNGTGAIGEVLSTPLVGEPLVGEPLVGFTQTFISIGAFDSEGEAQNCLKYVKSKFARTMLGVLKVTQHNPRSTWSKVPLQDFTPQSDIDWTQSIPDIDRQLYAKYGLDETEITFIEEKVKAME